MIIGQEKPVSWMNPSVAEDRSRAGHSEPEAMALMNAGKEPHTLTVGTRVQWVD